MQPREKMAMFGADALTDAELLAILLRTGMRNKPVLNLATEVLAAFQGRLELLSDAGLRELRSVRGLGEVKALELAAAFALSRRIAMHRIPDRPKMNVPLRIAEYMYEFYRDAHQEEMYVLLLDSQCCLIRQERVSVGLLDRSFVHPREIFRPAIRESSAMVAVCHNHPSGNITPSLSDVKATRQLAKSGEIIGISLVDHVIVGKRGEDGRIDYYSFREHGQLA